MITKEEFNTLQDRGFNVIPIVKEISLTNASPLSVFNTFLRTKNSFLLESIEGGNKWAQYSIIGLDCHDYFKISGNEVVSFENNQQTSFRTESPLDLIKDKIEKLDLKNSLIVNNFDSDNPFVKAAKNIKNIEFLKVDGINVYDILNNQKLIITKDSLNNIVERCQ